MATNRKKYIDNASNEELANTLKTGFYRMRTKININEGYIDVEKWILNWLSQEAEEQTQKEEIHLTMPEDENTRKVIEYIIPRLTLLSARLDKLEKKTFNAISDKEYKRVVKRYGEDLMKDFYRLEEETTEKEKTADEMFKILGYVKETGDDNDFIRYHNLDDNDRIFIERKRGKIVFSKTSGIISLIADIDEAEDKAIHKKIEELKNEQKP